MVLENQTIRPEHAMMWRCWFRHDWGKWGELLPVYSKIDAIFRRTDEATPIGYFQRATCERCGAIKERNV
jgi:hypothetical protein